jgi:hypothetical protein
MTGYALAGVGPWAAAELAEGLREARVQSLLLLSLVVVQLIVVLHSDVPMQALLPLAHMI